MNADLILRFSKCFLILLVFASLAFRSSIKIIFLSFILEERAWIMPSFFAFLDKLFTDLSPFKLWAIPPLLKILAFLEPWRAPPPPFWRPYFCVVPFTSDLFRVLALKGYFWDVRHWTTDAINSEFGSILKMLSLSSTVSTFFPSKLWTSNCIFNSLLFLFSRSFKFNIYFLTRFIFNRIF